MRYTLISILIVLSIPYAVMGQAQVLKSVYHAGDTLYRAEDRLPSNPRLIHSNLQNYWDFTGLMAPYVQEIYVKAATSGEENFETPGQCMFSTGDDVEYLVVIDQENMWIGGLVVQHGKYSVEGKFDSNLPLRVNTNEVGEEGAYSGTIVFDLATEIVAALRDSELSLMDSIRMVVDWDYHLSNDQKGQIQMENSLYDVVRQKLKKSVKVRTEIKQGSAWSVLNRPLPLDLPVELSSGTVFSFWSDEHADPLAVVQTDASENALSVLFSAQRKSGRRIMQSTPSQEDIYVYPNPSFGIVRFDIVNVPVGTYQLEIYNILGVRLRSYSLDIDGSMSYPLNLSDLKRGTYIYRLVDSYEKTLRSKRLVIITP